MTDRASLLERLERQALSASGVLRSMAEAKSLRQPGNEAGDKDLYMWPTPDQTTEGQAAAVIRADASTIEALSERIAALRDAGNMLAETVKLIKSALVGALTKRELEILMNDLHAWNVASLTPDLSQ